MTWQSFLKSKTATWLLSAVLVIACFFAVRILIEQHEINSEIDKLQTQADNIKKSDDQLSGLINYFNTPQYEEEQAREQLNLKKNGEYVVVLPSDDSNQNQAVAVAQPSNLHQWFNYFFQSK